MVAKVQSRSHSRCRFRAVELELKPCRELRRERCHVSQDLLYTLEERGVQLPIDAVDGCGNVNGILSSLWPGAGAGLGGPGSAVVLRMVLLTVQDLGEQL